MHKFFLGLGIAVLAAVLVLAGLFIYVRFGFLDTRADVPVNSIEKAIAMPAVDAFVDRRAPQARNPIEPSDENLAAGMKIYQANCSSCHGDIAHPHGKLAEGLYPRAPQFVEDAPDMSENENLFIIQHGIRWTGMPAWEQVLNQQQIWQVTTFLSHMDKLPPDVSVQWKNAAGSTTSQPPQLNAPANKGRTRMKM